MVQLTANEAMIRQEYDGITDRLLLYHPVRFWFEKETGNLYKTEATYRVRSAEQWAGLFLLINAARVCAFERGWLTARPPHPTLATLRAEGAAQWERWEAEQQAEAERAKILRREKEEQERPERERKEREERERKEREEREQRERKEREEREQRERMERKEREREAARNLEDSERLEDDAKAAQEAEDPSIPRWSPRLSVHWKIEGMCPDCGEWGYMRPTWHCGRQVHRLEVIKGIGPREQDKFSPLLPRDGSLEAVGGWCPACLDRIVIRPTHFDPVRHGHAHHVRLVHIRTRE